MAKIAFFCIPAFGHTNPTLEVVKELTQLNHEVIYFSYEQFREKIEAVHAKFIACDAYDNNKNVKPEDAQKVGKDIDFSIELLTNTTLALDEMVCHALIQYQPDCVVADSMAVWGKFAALKLNIPFISSTTTFVFNRYSARIMKTDFSQFVAMMKSIPKVNRQVKRLKEKGYPVKNLLSIIQNDNETETLVYTSRQFQPCAATFSSHYHFVGPSIKIPLTHVEKAKKHIIYISLGTVNNQLPSFFKNCIEALKTCDYQVVMSIGNEVHLEQLGSIPDHFIIRPCVNQIEVLQHAAVFLSHGGMNSVNESLYFEVPLVLFPQTAEQGGVTHRVVELKAGVQLKNDCVEEIRRTIYLVLQDSSYQRQASIIAESFKQAGGAQVACQAILSYIGKKQEKIK